jgi:hypothetical protein
MLLKNTIFQQTPETWDKVSTLMEKYKDALI